MAGINGCIDNLRNQIQNNLVTSLSQRDFLPTDKLHEIFTLQAVKGAIKELNCGPDDRIKLADTIYHQGKRVFAMLIYSYWQDLIIEFRKHGALDSRLPLTEADAMTIVEPGIALRIAREVQWGFCPYTFPENMSEHHREIQSKMIIPFIGTEQIGFGAFSNVEKMTISLSHQHFDKDAKIMQVVQKKLKRKGKTEEFERENRCLRLLNQLHHPNIIPLWGSYTCCDEQNFLFPYIDMDLGSFLRAKTRHQDFQWDFTFYSALTGLASALSKTHYLLLNQADHDIDFEAIGYHHDIRPPNILVGSDTFILADFGLGRLKQAGDPSHTPYKWISGDYVSPESTDSQENPLTTNRATDVWAFGCLIAEVITYMLKGAEGVEEFRTERLTPGKFPQWKDASFYQPCGDVKKEVINWMRALRGDNSHSDFVPLLVDLALDALQPDPRTRPDMNTIYIRLKVLSMRKHFHSIQEKFCEVRETGEKLVPPDKRHLGSLGYAYERFKAWGNTLTLDKKGSLVYDKDQPEGSIEIMKKLFQALREELETQHSGDGPALLSLEHRIVQSVESLWKFLPNTLLPSAEDQWRKKPDGQPVEERQSSYHTADDVVSAPSIANPIDPLKSEFEEKAQNFKNNLGNITFFHEILKITSIGDVYDITDKIQNEQNEHNGLRNLAKIRRYLERLKGYADVINGIISGSRHILALLWGPIGMLLQLARPLNKAYDSFIDAVAEVGQSLPEFQASTSIFKQNKEAKEILPLFFKDILDFYSEALNFFCHHNWMHIFNRLWPQQYMQHAEIVNRIRRLTRLMRTEIHIGDIQQEDEFRKKAQESFKAQKRENCAQEFHRIMVSFSPERYDTTLDRLLSHRYQATGTWLFMDKTFTQWLNSSQEETRILWLKGIPGAGKTVLSSAIIDQLRNVQGTKTAFAFLTYQEAKTSALSTIHSLIFQLAERNEDLMAIVCESMGRDLRGNINGAGDILSSLIHYAGLVYLVIDGVDEVSETERGRLITELLRLVGICGTLRIILSSRPEADLTRLLDDKAAVIQIHDHNKRSIEDYVIERAQYIFGNRRVPLDKKAKIMKLLEPLASRAEGMFLYARLVMDMVASIHDLSELQKELTVLPENLDAAYHRIIVRLESHNDKRRAEKARMLLGWVACSTAPITVEEAHQALVVIPGNRDQVFEMVSKLDAVELLGPIVETVDNYIRFVHFTAKEYISSPHLGEQLIDTTQATSDLALRCITYLCQHHHDPGLSFEKRYENVTTGQYSLHTFAIRMWFELVCQYFRLIGETDPSTELVESIQMLWEYREIRDLDDTAEDEGDVNNDESGNEAIFKPLKKKHPLLYQLLCRVSRFRNSSFLFTGNISQDFDEDTDDPLLTSKISQLIREASDIAVCSSPTDWLLSGKRGCHEACANILYYYGPRPFKCKFIGCKTWQDGFQERTLRRKHERSHDKPLKCHISGCEFELVGFLSERMRQNHIKHDHRNDPKKLSFDTESLTQDKAETMLSDFIKVNEIEAVRKILSTFPTILEDYKTQRELKLLAASTASGDILKLLKGPTEESREWDECITESINARNGITLRYFSSIGLPCNGAKKKGSNFSRYLPPLSHRQIVLKLVSCDWLEGMQIWTSCILNRLNLLSDATKKGLKFYLISDMIYVRQFIRAASHHPLGYQQLLCVWKDSGIAPFLDDIWANRTLKYVAEAGLSTTLAVYLIEQGAHINHRRGPKSRTALQYAVSKSSAGGAEMIRFLLLNGADPEIGREGTSVRRRLKKIRRAPGAKDIYRWLGKTWKELLEETKSIRDKAKELSDVPKYISTRDLRSRVVQTLI